MMKQWVSITVCTLALGGVLSAQSTPARGCPDATETWMGLRVCEETEDRSGYDRDDFGSAYSSKEDEIVASLPQSDGQVYTPYTCTLFDIEPDGTAATDIEHIIALAEAYDSGLAPDRYRAFAADLDNLTIAVPSVNRNDKSDRDAGEWTPAQNRGWFADRVVEVKREYDLAVNPAERDALAALLAADASRTVSCAAAEPEPEPEKDDFEYWDTSGNGDLTCAEAMRNGADGLKLPAYEDDHDGTGLIYAWLERGTSSDPDMDGIACESNRNPNGYVPSSTTPAPTLPETVALFLAVLLLGSGAYLLRGQHGGALPVAVRAPDPAAR